MSARDDGRAAAQRLLHTDSLSKESVDMIADAVMDAFAVSYWREVLHEAAERLAALGTAALEAAESDGGRTTPSDPKYTKAATFYAAAKFIDPDFA